MVAPASGVPSHSVSVIESWESTVRWGLLGFVKMNLSNLTCDAAILCYDLDSYYTEAKAYADIGFFPVAVTNQPQRAGLFRIILLNFFALVWTPPPILIVTYVKR